MMTRSMKFFMTLFWCFLAVMFMTPGLVGAEEPAMAPINPLFQPWIESPVPLEQFTSDGNALGYIEGPVAPEQHDPDRFPELLGAGVTDPKYDLRDPNGDLDTSDSLVSPVKNQNPCGSCWTFATYGSQESHLLQMESALFDFSENNLKHLHGFDQGPCAGGNAYMSSAYLARYSGPISEALDPYDPSPTADYCTTCSPVRYVDNHIFLPKRASALDLNYLKQALLNYGALHTSMYYDNAFYDAVNYNYYYSGGNNANHAVTLVGWDDNRVIAGAPGNGAFIIKNSWGTGWGEGGYFYISYYDTKTAYGWNVAFTDITDTSTIPFDKIYQYDPLGWVGEFSTPWSANIFTPVADGVLNGVGLYLPTAMSFDIYIYDDFNGSTFSTLLTSQTGSRAWPGWYTIPLTTPVDIYNGNSFGVVVKLYNGGTYPSVFEYAVAGYSSSATANAGESYYSFDGASFTDLTTYDATANFCIKAFVLQEALPNDFGDAPDPTYPTLLANNGARHVVVPGYHLGAAIDSEPDGQPHINALGDDNAAISDEDGVAFGGALLPGAQVPVTITASAPGRIDAWIDLNRDGDWMDIGEQIFNNVPVVAGANNLGFKVRSNAAGGSTYARFRFSSTGGLPFFGPADDGEVEDYEVMIAKAPFNLIHWNGNLVADFGSNGMWYHNGTSWVWMTNKGNVGKMVVWQGKLVVDFGATYGLQYYNGSWNWMSNNGNVSDMIVWFDGTTERLVVDFGSGRKMYTHDGTGWTWLNNKDGVAGMTVWNNNLVVDFGFGRGVYYYNGAAWIWMTNKDNIARMIPWNNGMAEVLAVDFGAGRGMYTYDGSWHWLNNKDGVNAMTVYGPDLVVDFGSGRSMYRYNGSMWYWMTNKDTVSRMVPWNDGVSNKLCVDFGAGRGLYSYYTGTWQWMKNANDIPEITVWGNRLAFDFGSGVGIYNYNGVWNWMRNMSTRD